MGRNFLVVNLRQGNVILYKTDDQQKETEVTLEHLKWLQDDPSGFGMVFSSILLSEGILNRCKSEKRTLKAKDGNIYEIYDFCRVMVGKSTIFDGYIAYIANGTNKDELTFLCNIETLDKLQNLVLDICETKVEFDYEN